MKRQFIKDIKEKGRVEDAFLVTKKETGVSKAGKPYLSLKIADRTGELDARVWDDAENISKKFQKDDVVNIKGYAVAYLGGLQVNVSDAVKAGLSGGDIADFLPASKRDRKEMMAELKGIISSMADAHLKGLLNSIFADPDVHDRFMTAPAAKAMHHPYIGGLLEHVLSICGLASCVCEHYRGRMDRDLVIAGAILHDVGKIYELSYARSFDYTDEGRLLGHITLGVEMITSKMAPDFPRDKAMLLKHMMLSHHGRFEYGSPKRPKTLEAHVLYYLDDLDAKVAAINSLVDSSGMDGPVWSPYQKIFERAIYLGNAEKEKETNEPSDDKDADTGVDPDLFGRR